MLPLIIAGLAASAISAAAQAHAASKQAAAQKAAARSAANAATPGSMGGGAMASAPKPVASLGAIQPQQSVMGQFQAAPSGYSPQVVTQANVSAQPALGNMWASDYSKAMAGAGAPSSPMGVTQRWNQMQPGSSMGGGMY